MNKVLRQFAACFPSDSCRHCRDDPAAHAEHRRNRRSVKRSSSIRSATPCTRTEPHRQVDNAVCLFFERTARGLRTMANRKTARGDCSCPGSSGQPSTAARAFYSRPCGFLSNSQGALHEVPMTNG
jgi:hypothetical protein